MYFERETETRAALENAGPGGLVLGRDAKADPEAARRFAERLTEQGREHMGHGGDARSDYDEED